MIKLRQAGYCNLKIFLIYLVVYGHWIEPYIGSSKLLMTEYEWIYLFHMPLFSFLSGLFMKSARDAKRQIKRMLPIYAVCQTAAVIFGGGAVKILTPWWHLWYLLSYCFWAGAAWLWFRFAKGHGRYIVLFAAVTVGCAAGYFSFVGRMMSLSRTIVFFPYFWAGVIADTSFKRKKLRLCGVAALAAAVMIGIPLTGAVPPSFLYHAAAYGSLKYGFLLRLAAYAVGGFLCLFLLSAVPDRRYPFTKAGTDTIPAYLAHAPLVLLLRKNELPSAVVLFGAAFILYAVYKILQWRSTMYGIITSDERRESRWRALKMSIKNTKDPSIGSYSP